MIEAGETANFELFRDCLSTTLIDKFATEPPKSKRKRKVGRVRKKSGASSPTDIAVENDGSNDAEELSEFINYIATEVYICFPSELKTLTYSTYTNTPAFQSLYTPPLTSSAATSILGNLDPAIIETLTAYDLLQPSHTAADLLAPVLTAYITYITTPPPPPSQTKQLAQGCEICQRDYIPLTYHHLIPRMVHEKAVKRGWHTKDELANVAWLCRACHSFVHRVAGHEELARDLYTVERLLEREEVRRFAGWVGRVRWKAR